ncbi:13099_t:CDS:1 [Dentiscutata heterogama]|uniref:13099_t:CDS:1 n=1 Tax=Dentiscutata heterogama TaxID=1316150 RepID=A0ACA9KBW2_9GLOM|nr:13099_t:CDS:1 [Dentiscutata heterogama]
MSSPNNTSCLTMEEVLNLMCIHGGKKKFPSSFFLYKNKHNFSPSEARIKYNLEPPGVRTDYEQCAELIRLSTTDIFLAIDLCVDKFTPYSTSHFIIQREQTQSVQRSQLSLMIQNMIAACLDNVAINKPAQLFQSSVDSVSSWPLTNAESIFQAPESVSHFEYHSIREQPTQKTSVPFLISNNKQTFASCDNLEYNFDYLVELEQDRESHSLELTAQSVTQLYFSSDTLFNLD